MRNYLRPPLSDRLSFLRPGVLRPTLPPPQRLVVDTVGVLANAGFAAYGAEGVTIAPTDAGREMSRFYVRFKTAKSFMELRDKEGVREVMWALASAEARSSTAAARPRWMATVPSALHPLPLSSPPLPKVVLLLLLPSACLLPLRSLSGSSFA